MTYLVAEFVLSSVGSYSGGFFFFFNVTKVTAGSRLIIVLGKDESSFANVSVFWGWGREPLQVSCLLQLETILGGK